MHHLSSAALVLALAGALCGPAAAHDVKSPRDPASGHASGKVSMQDMHFSTRTEAAATCDKAPITTAPDGSFVCSVPKATYDLATSKK